MRALLVAVLLALAAASPALAAEPRQRPRRRGRPVPAPDRVVQRRRLAHRQNAVDQQPDERERGEDGERDGGPAHGSSVVLPRVSSDARRD